MSSIQTHFDFVRLALISLISALIAGCGDSSSRYEVYQKVTGVTWPTRENFGRWKDIWDNHSWIVALSQDSRELKSKPALRGVIAGAMARQMKLADESLITADLSVDIAQLLQTNVLPIANFERTLPSGDGPLPVFGFAEIRLRGGFGGLQNILSRSGIWKARIDAAILTGGRDAFLMGWMWNALESAKGIEFAEPNLLSDVLQESDEAILTQKFKSRWNTDLIGSDVAVPAMLEGNAAVVAVIDTGVDSGYDAEGLALSGRIYRNAGEDPERGAKPLVDDDGNGWVDDYIGVNASIPKGELDLGPAPLPGSNDVGGAGQHCPSDQSAPKAQSCGHGTHVAGIIAAAPIANSSIVGVCPMNCKILPIRVAKRCIIPAGFKGEPSSADCQTGGEPFPFQFDPENQVQVDGKISDAAQLQGLGYILDLTSPGRPDLLVTNVVNLSIGKYFSSRSLSLLARRLTANDVLMVAAAGNSNVEVPMFPAAYRDVIAVCSTSHDVGDAGIEESEPNGGGTSAGPVRGRQLKSRFSNFGDWVDICAPGSNIESIIPGQDQKLQSGTSQASPHVAGIAGFIKAIYPALRAPDIRSVILRYANFDLLYGRLPGGGMANAEFNFSPYQGIKVFLLGSGMLSAANIYYALTDAEKARTLLSQAEAAVMLGDTSQVTSGCVVSSLAAGHPLKHTEAWTSLPVTLGGAWMLLRFLRRKSNVSADQLKPADTKVG